MATPSPIPIPIPSPEQSHKSFQAFHTDHIRVIYLHEIIFLNGSRLNEAVMLTQT